MTEIWSFWSINLRSISAGECFFWLRVAVESKERRIRPRCIICSKFCIRWEIDFSKNIQYTSRSDWCLRKMRQMCDIRNINEIGKNQKCLEIGGKWHHPRIELNWTQCLFHQQWWTHSWRLSRSEGSVTSRIFEIFNISTDPPIYTWCSEYSHLAQIAHFH